MSLHTLCTKDSCKPALPFDKIPTTLAAYWDRQAFVCVVGFMIVLRVLSLIPVGSTVRSVNGKDLRMNGFLGLLILMALMPVMVYKKSRPKVSIKIPSEYFNRYNFMQTFHFLHMTYLFAIPALSMESTFSSWPRP